MKILKVLDPKIDKPREGDFYCGQAFSLWKPIYTESGHTHVFIPGYIYAREIEIPELLSESLAESVAEEINVYVGDKYGRSYGIKSILMRRIAEPPIPRISDIGIGASEREVNFHAQRCYQAEIDNLKEILRNLRVKQLKIDQENEDLKSQLAEKDGQIERIEEVNKQVHLRAEKAESKLANQNRHISEYNACIKELREEISQKRKYIDLLETQRLEFKEAATAKSTWPTEEVYIILKEGDAILEGDEYYNDRYWSETSITSKELICETDNQLYRRKVTLPLWPSPHAFKDKMPQEGQYILAIGHKSDSCKNFIGSMQIEDKEHSKLLACYYTHWLPAPPIPQPPKPEAKEVQKFGEAYYWSEKDEKWCLKTKPEPPPAPSPGESTLLEKIKEASRHDTSYHGKLYREILEQLTRRGEAR